MFGRYHNKRDEEKDLRRTIGIDVANIIVRIREYRVEEDKQKVVAVVGAPFQTEETLMKLEMNLVEKRTHHLWALFEGLNDGLINPGDSLELSGTFKFNVIVIKGKLMGTPVFIVDQPPKLIRLSENRELRRFVPREDVRRISYKNKDDDGSLVKIFSTMSDNQGGTPQTRSKGVRRQNQDHERDLYNGDFDLEDNALVENDSQDGQAHFQDDQGGQGRGRAKGASTLSSRREKDGATEAQGFAKSSGLSSNTRSDNARDTGTFRIPDKAYSRITSTVQASRLPSPTLPLPTGYSQARLGKTYNRNTNVDAGNEGSNQVKVNVSAQENAVTNPTLTLSKQRLVSQEHASVNRYSPGKQNPTSRKEKQVLDFRAERSVSPRAERSVSPRAERSVSPRTERSVSPRAARSVSHSSSVVSSKSGIGIEPRGHTTEGGPSKSLGGLSSSIDFTPRMILSSDVFGDHNDAGGELDDDGMSIFPELSMDEKGQPAKLVSVKRVFGGTTKRAGLRSEEMEAMGESSIMLSSDEEGKQVNTVQRDKTEAVNAQESEMNEDEDEDDEPLILHRKHQSAPKQPRPRPIKRGRGRPKKDKDATNNLPE